MLSTSSGIRGGEPLSREAVCWWGRGADAPGPPATPRGAAELRDAGTDPKKRSSKKQRLPYPSQPASLRGRLGLGLDLHRKRQGKKLREPDHSSTRGPLGYRVHPKC